MNSDISNLWMEQSNILWISVTILLALITCIITWLLMREKQELALLEQKYDLDIDMLQQKMTQLEQTLDSKHKELDELDVALDRSEFESKQAYGSLMAANEKLQQLGTIESQRQQAVQRSEQLVQLNAELSAVNREQEARHIEEIRATEGKLQILEQAEQRLKVQFENLANQLFENKVKSVDEQNKLSLDSLLAPLKEQLSSFKKQVNDGFSVESKERHTLVHEINNLKRLNEQMAKDAVNLTQALKGDNKQQGNWGEVVLANVLRDSGLREGHEFQTQVTLHNESGKRYQPDVIVNLPENKQVVIDSKVTLIAFERYFNAESEGRKKQALNEHVISVRTHVKQLSGKDYQKLKGITSLDYVLLFIPIEPAFQLAIEAEPNLIKDAMENNIIIVSPTTLLVALRTINNLWRNERQNQNAKLIAEKASKLYDKMRLFVADMESVGDSIDRAQGHYKGAMNKLVTGKGNLIRQVEGFKGLGVEVKKNISHSIVDIAEDYKDN